MKTTAKKGVRAIAVFEASKGIVAVTVSLALILLRHRDFNVVAREIISVLQLDASGWFANRLTEFAGGITPSYIELIAAAIFGYSLLRFTEAYGLWKFRPWAQWLGIISGMIYIPFELYDIFTRPSWFGIVILILNVFIVAYLYYFRHEQQLETKLHESEAGAN